MANQLIANAKVSTLLSASLTVSVVNGNPFLVGDSANSAVSTEIEQTNILASNGVVVSLI